MGFSNGPTVVTNGLVLALDAGDRNSYPGSGTVWTDLSGNGRNGTLTNGPTFSGANGGSIVFDGTDDVAIITGQAVITGTGDFTLCSFVKRSVIDTFGYICGNYGVSNNGVEFYYYSDNKVTLYTVDIYLYSNTLITDTNWHYVCATRASGVTIIYIDGISDNTGTANVSIPGTNPFTIGNGFDFTSEALNGRVANCYAYNRALSASEILQNFNAQRTRFGI